MEGDRQEAISGKWRASYGFNPTPRGDREIPAAKAHIHMVRALPDKRTQFIYDGVPGEPFDTAIPQQDGSELVISPDGSRVAYFGQRGDSYFIGYDGTESPPYSGITRSVKPTFSADGSRFAYGAYIEGAPRLIVDGQPQYKWLVAPVPPVFSPDGKRLAFAAQNVTLREGEKSTHYRQWVVLDGVDQPQAQALAKGPTAMQFSPDGSRFAYITVEDGRGHMVVDGLASDWYFDIDFPQFSPDGRRFVFVAARDKQHMTVVENNQDGPTFWRCALPVFSADSRRLAYWAFGAKGRAVAVVDGRAGPEFADGYGNVAFNPEGTRLAYLGTSRGAGLLGGLKLRTRAVIDGVQGEEWEQVASDPHWSPDGTHVAFSARRGRTWSIVVDDVPGPAFDKVAPPRYSSSGKLAYLVQSGKSYAIMFDGTLGPWFDQAETLDEHGKRAGEGIRFSPDGEHVAVAASLGGTLRPMVDGYVGPAVDAIDRVIFEDNRVVFICLRHGDVARVWIELGRA